MTLPLGLVTLEHGQGGRSVIVFAAITAVVVPVLIVFLVFQRSFVASIASVGIRGYPADRDHVAPRRSTGRRNTSTRCGPAAQPHHPHHAALRVAEPAGTARGSAAVCAAAVVPVVVAPA